MRLPCLSLLLAFAAVAAFSASLFAQESPPVIEFFTADEDTIFAGHDTTLRWHVEDFDTIRIEPIGWLITSPFLQSATLSPQSTTTYELTATNAFGVSVATLTVTVSPFLIERFTVFPRVLGRIDPARLRWQVRGEGEVELEGFGPQAPGGFLEIVPGATREYRLTVTNSDGPMVQTATVTVTVLEFDRATVELSWGIEGLPGRAPNLRPDTSFEVHVLGQSLDRYRGFEFGVDLPRGLKLLSVALHGERPLNVGVGNDWIVGLASCSMFTPFLQPLATLRLMVADPDLLAGEAIALRASNPASVPGTAAFLDCEGQVVPMQIGQELAIPPIVGFRVPSETVTFGTIKSRY